MGESNVSGLAQDAGLRNLPRLLRRGRVEKDRELALRDILRHLRGELMTRDHLYAGIVAIIPPQLVSCTTADRVISA